MVLALAPMGCTAPVATGGTPGQNQGLNPASRGIAALGRLQPKGGLIDVAGTPGLRIGEMLVKEGQVVQKGDPLFVLDTYPILAATAEAAKVRFEEAQSLHDLEERNKAVLRQEFALQEAKVLTIDPFDLESLRAQVEVREKSRAKAQADLDRLHSLKEAGSTAVSKQELEAARLQVDVAEAEVKVIHAQLKKADLAHALEKTRLTHEQEKLDVLTEKAKLAAQLASARAAAETARQHRDTARIVAPITGRVLRILTQEGESIGAQPVIQIGDIDHMVVIAEVSELDILRLREAAMVDEIPAQVAAMGHQIELRGTLTLPGIGQIVGKNNLYSLNPTFQADDRIIEVEVELAQDVKTQEAVHGLTNLQVDVTFPLESGTTSQGGEPTQAAQPRPVNPTQPVSGQL